MKEHGLDRDPAGGKGLLSQRNKQGKGKESWKAICLRFCICRVIEKESRMYWGSPIRIKVLVRNIFIRDG